jgi:hypothetical protein
MSGGAVWDCYGKKEKWSGCLGVEASRPVSLRFLLWNMLSRPSYGTGVRENASPAELFPLICAESMTPDLADYDV